MKEHDFEDLTVGEEEYKISRSINFTIKNLKFIDNKVRTRKYKNRSDYINQLIEKDKSGDENS